MADEMPTVKDGRAAFWGVILGGIVALLGSLGTSFVTDYFSTQADERKQWEALRTSAYVDYFRELFAAAQAVTDAEKRDTLAHQNDALTRIAIYGSTNVNDALAKFETSSAPVDSKESRLEIIAVYRAMRSDVVPADQGLSDDVLYRLLYRDSSGAP